MARPNKYFSNIKPNFEKIKEMLEDMHECDVANYFGVTRQSWNNYRKTYKEFDNLIKNTEIYQKSRYRRNLRKVADGYITKEEKEYIRDENGKVIKEITTRYNLPNVKANSLMLDNIDPNWSENPKELKIKKEELQIKKDNSF